MALPLNLYAFNIYCNFSSRGSDARNSETARSLARSRSECGWSRGQDFKILASRRRKVYNCSDRTEYTATNKSFPIFGRTNFLDHGVVVVLDAILLRVDVASKFLLTPTQSRNIYSSISWESFRIEELCTWPGTSKPNNSAPRPPRTLVGSLSMSG